MSYQNCSLSVHSILLSRQTQLINRFSCQWNNTLNHFHVNETTHWFTLKQNNFQHFESFPMVINSYGIYLKVINLWNPDKYFQHMHVEDSATIPYSWACLHCYQYQSELAGSHPNKMVRYCHTSIKWISWDVMISSNMALSNKEWNINSTGLKQND